MRTPQKVFQHHSESLAAADIEGIAAGYAGDSILITPGGDVRGRTDIREAFRQLLADLPDAK